MGMRNDDAAEHLRHAVTMIVGVGVVVWVGVVVVVMLVVVMLVVVMLVVVMREPVHGLDCLSAIAPPHVANRS
jgi:hypothetical protein